MNGNNSYPKHALAGQNDGSGTRKQNGQSRLAKRAHLETLRLPAPARMESKIISYTPWTHASPSNFKRNKYAPKVGSKARVIWAGGTRIGHFE